MHSMANTGPATAGPEQAVVLYDPQQYRVNMAVGRIFARVPLLVAYNRRCLVCGRYQPDTAAPYSYKEPFVEDDSTMDCWNCSALWVLLMLELFHDAMAAEAKRRGL